MPVVFLLAACGTKPTPAPIVVAPPRPVASATPPPPPKAEPKPVVAPSAPAKQPVDPHIKVTSGLLLAASDTEVWVTIDEKHTAVVDRATHCAVESYVESPLIRELFEAKSDGFVEESLKKSEVLQAIRDVVGLGLRFGARERDFTHLSWTPDGHHIFMELRDLVWHSADGGQSFSLFDENYGSRVSVSPDGKTVIWERAATKNGPSCVREEFARGCNGNRNWTASPVDGLAPRKLTSQYSSLVDFDETNHARFTRSDKTEACVDTFDLGAPSPATSSCVPIPAKATGNWASQQFESISPNGRYGIVKWEEGRPNLVGTIALTYVVSLVDLQSKSILKTFTDVRASVDDVGDIFMQTASEGGGDHVYFSAKDDKKKRQVSNGYLLAFDHEALVGTDRPGTLGTRKCDLLRAVKKPK